MRTIIILSGAAALLGACTTESSRPMESGPRAQMTAELEGRVAGEPVTCVNMRELRGNRSTEDGAIIFEGSGGRIYVNSPPGGCPSLNFGRALVTRTPSTQLCRGDIARVVDTATGMEMGSCGLGEFVPYSRRAG